MINKVIRAYTRMLGKPVDWTEKDHGKCGALAILDIEQDYGETNTKINSMVSCWEPTPDELKRLLLGGSVYLRVLGTQHPPVSIWAGHPPVLDEMDPTEHAISVWKAHLIDKITGLVVGDDRVPMTQTETIEALVDLVFNARLGGRA